MATLKDVARRANLSPTTVSRVLNNRGYISEKTRKLVYDTIEEMNYHPSKIARTLLSKKSNLFAVIVPDSSNPFFCELVTAIEHRCQQLNYRLILCNSFDTYERESNHLKVLQEQNVDGLIACSHILDSESYHNVGFPVVSFDKDYNNPSIPIVCSDNFAGGQLAAAHLYERGCRRLLHFSGPLEDPSLLGHGRFRGFKAFCDEHGVEYENFATENHFSCEYYYDFVRRSAGDSIDRFDGAFCSNDLIAFALYRLLREKGIDVPSKFKIVGFDNTSFTRTLLPRLTTVAQDIPLIAETLVDKLMQMQDGNPAANAVTTLAVKLVQGETT